MTTDYALLAPPRITAKGFRAILARHGSPAAGDAAACYAAFVARGVDPAVGLAIFQHESGYGRAGVAVRNRSWGNIRHAGKFVAYSSWTAGAQGLADLLVVYGHDLIRPGVKTSTVLTFARVYAPSADHNDPKGYGAAVAGMVGAWSRLYAAGPPAGAVGRLLAHGLAALWTPSASGDVLVERKSASAHGLRFSAYTSGRVYRRIPKGGRGTFYKLLNGSHHGAYVHVSDHGITWAPVP